MPLYSENELFVFSSDPIEPEHEIVEDLTTPSNTTQIPFPEISFDGRLEFITNSLEYSLRDGQVRALQGLYEGRDILLVARTGYGKTLIIKMRVESVLRCDSRKYVLRVRIKEVGRYWDSVSMRMVG